mgnify:CR=1 FL=1
MGELIQAVLASANENKLRELGHALDGWSLELLDAEEYPPESGATYLENARAKAEFGRTLAPDRWVLGEDSGVEIEGSAAARGVRSARWAAGREAERALEELEGVQGDGRRARYVCELVAISPDGARAPRDGRPRGPDRRRAERRAKASASTRSSFRTARTEPSRSSATTGSGTTRTEHFAARALLASIMQS